MENFAKKKGKKEFFGEGGEPLILGKKLPKELSRIDPESGIFEV